jgi:multidrug efflux pump subunit AcrA (membrane-fusion protein)
VDDAPLEVHGPAARSRADGVALLVNDPPRGVYLVLGWLLVFAVSAALAISVGVGFPDVAKGRFTLAPTDGTDPVKAPWPGTIEQIYVEAGSQVREGAPLFRMRSEDLAMLVKRRGAARDKYAAVFSQGASLEARHRSQTAAFSARLQSVEAELAFAERRFETSTRLSELAGKQLDAGVLSESEKLQAEYATAGEGRAREQLLRLRDDTRAELARLKIEYETERAARAAELAGLKGDLEAIQALLPHGEFTHADEHGNALTIRAPYSGTVTQIGPQRVGALVERGLELCRVAREGSPLMAQVSMAETRAGKVQKNQPIKLLFDAFPHTRYGTKTSRIAWVNPTTEDGKLLLHGALADAYMVVDGARHPLRAGMQGEARIILGERTILDYVLEPLRSLKQQVRPR